MKRFLVFGGSEYYPGGGFRDYLSEHDTLDHAIAYARGWCDADPHCRWVYVFDTEIREEVFALNPSDSQH